MKKYIESKTTRLLHRIITRLAPKAMPVILDSYYDIYSPVWHPHHQMRKEALAETVDYIKGNMPQALIRKDDFQVISYAVEEVRVDGLYLEFGVRTGTTINIIAGHKPQQTIFGFDSFQGLPENWSGWAMSKGTFTMAELPKVPPSVELIKGWFEQSLPVFLQNHEGPVAFVHIDSDLYSSAKTILDNLAGRVRPGTIIVFNEYFNYPNWKEHEYKAFQEFCQAHAVSYEYICWGHFAVALRINAIVFEK